VLEYGVAWQKPTVNDGNISSVGYLCFSFLPERTPCPRPARAEPVRVTLALDRACVAVAVSVAVALAVAVAMTPEGAV
jgi:predicted aconitase